MIILLYTRGNIQNQAWCKHQLLKAIKTTVTPESKIKILIFTPTLECGGSEKYISLLCDHISKRFEVTLVVLNNAYPFYTIHNTGIEITDLEVKHVRHSFFKARRIIARKRPDIIYTTANHLNLMFAIFRSFIPGKAKIVARESSIVSINSRRAKSPGLYGWLIKKYYRRLDLIICQSAWMQKDLVVNYGIAENKTIVLHNPVEEMVDAGNEDLSSRKKAGGYKFLTVARLSEEKDITLLVNAVALLPFPYQYHIIGEGEKRKELEELILARGLNEKIFLAGEKQDPYAGMRDADLVLVGSHYEGFPNVVLEAGALGIPVVAFDAPGGIAEIIEDRVNGLLVKERSKEAFSAAVERALYIQFDKRQIIENNRMRYSLRENIAKTELMFMDVVKNLGQVK